MFNLKVNIKKLNENAIIPTKATDGSAGLDMYALGDGVARIENIGPIITYKTGIALEIPEGYVGLIFPRSSIGVKTSLMLSNHVGVIDSDYRGEITFKFRDFNNFYGNARYKDGDKIGQLIIMPYPNIEFNEVEELNKTERGEGGYGSTGE